MLPYVAAAPCGFTLQSWQMEFFPTGCLAIVTYVRDL
jgi:hypothetical protein